MPIINVFASICNGNGMGKNGGVCWYDPYDCGRFKLLTRGQILIMGAGAWRSLSASNRPIKERDNFIVTRTTEDIVTELSKRRYVDEYTVQVFDCPPCAMEKAFDSATKNNQSIWIVGGQSMYNEFIHCTDHLYLTEIDREYENDRFFPDFKDDFNLVTSESHPNDSQVYFNFYERKIKE